MTDLSPVNVHELIRQLDSKTFAMPRLTFRVEHPDYAFADVSYERVPSQVDVTLHKGSAIQGRVVFGDSGRPAAGVHVMLQSVPDHNQNMDDDPTPESEATTDEQGRYRMANLRPGKYNVWATAPDWTIVALDSFEIGTGEERTAPDLTFVKGGFLAGRLVDADTGETVSIGENDGYVSVGVHGPSRPPSGAAIDGARVKPDGSFEIQLPAGWHHVYMSGLGPFEIDGDQRGGRQLEIIDGVQAETIFRVRRPERAASIDVATPTTTSSDMVDAELEKELDFSYDLRGGAVEGDEIVGVVADEKGKPLEGVLVDAWTWYPGNETRTDAQGHFRLKGFERDQEVEVEFTKPGYCPRLFMTMSVGRVNWKITLNSRTYFDGRVTGPDGKPVPGGEDPGVAGAV